MSHFVLTNSGPNLSLKVQYTPQQNLTLSNMKHYSAHLFQKII